MASVILQLHNKDNKEIEFNDQCIVELSQMYVWSVVVVLHKSFGTELKSGKTLLAKIVVKLTHLPLQMSLPQYTTLFAVSR